MTRKDFLKTSFGGFLAGIIYLSKVGCKGTPASPDISGIAQKVFLSSSTNGHTHTVIIYQSEIDNPPAGGISRSVSLSDGHVHTFSMTQAELLLVKNRDVVEVFDSEVSNHSHRYRIEKWY